MVAKKKTQPVTIRLQLTDDDIAQIAKAAHSEDLSLNQWVSLVLREVLDEDLWVSVIFFWIINSTIDHEQKKQNDNILAWHNPVDDIVKQPINSFPGINMESSRSMSIYKRDSHPDEIL